MNDRIVYQDYPVDSLCAFPLTIMRKLMSQKRYRWRYSNYDPSHIKYALKNAASMHTWTPKEKVPYHCDYLQMGGGTFSVYITDEQKENIQAAVKYLIGMQDVVGNVNVVIVSKEILKRFFTDKIGQR